MLFNSFEFVALLVATFVLYYAPPLSRLQVPTLVVASLIFYGAFQPTLLLLLLLSLAVNIVASYLIIAGQPRWRVASATLGVIANLSVLTFFKYGPLLIGTLPFDTGRVGASIIALPLPLGISFFTFHGISLLVDTLRAQPAGPTTQPNAKSLSTHASGISLYFLFFPQLVAGPITKSRNFLPQIHPKLLANVDWEFAFRNAALGYFLKMVIADNLAQQTFWIQYPYFLSRSSADLLIMLAGYSMQIFADFAGYSLIAVGLAALFGYMLPQNFNAPYLAQSFSEFWTRWHMSLSSFLREYLYIPLGGNRHGSVRTYVNLLVVMLLGGLWHGAAWSFMVWGGLHGAALAAERMIGDRIPLPDTAIVRVARTIIVFVYVSFAWLLFKLTDFGSAIEYVMAISRNWDVPSWPTNGLYVAIYSVPIVAYHFIRRFRLRIAVIDRRPIAACVYGLMLFLIVTNSGQAQAFVYFQF